MKQFLICVILAFFTPFCIAQPLHDNVWLFGDGSSPEFPDEGVRFDFDFEKAPITTAFYNPFWFTATNASICDSSGHLLFFTNGCEIANKNYEIMENGYFINPGQAHDFHCEFGYRTKQGVLILPDINKDSVYEMFHIRLEDDTYLATDLLLTSIDLNQNGGLGKVIKKNTLLLRDTFSSGELTACQHANGRDWWIMLPRLASNRFVRFLYSAEGLTGPYYQTIGPTMNEQYWSGQTVFSPDGKRFVRMNPQNDLLIYDFDRCSGLLSNPIAITDIEEGSGGISIAPNNRFLYLSQTELLYQYDLWAADIEASKTLIATYDGFMGPLWTQFHVHKLAPNGKIYIVTPNGNRYFHIIHHPNRSGKACYVEQHGLELPADNFLSLPNLPYFRTGVLDGSACDTLGIDNRVAARFRPDVDTLDPFLMNYTDISAFWPTYWYWDFGDGNTSTEQHPIHNYAHTGTYTVCLTAGNANGEDSYCRDVLVGTTSVGPTRIHSKSERHYVVYPNPTEDIVFWKKSETAQLQNDSEALHDYTAELYDVMGRLVHSKQFSFIEEAEGALSLALLPEGIYRLLLRDGGGAVLYSGNISKL